MAPIFIGYTRSFILSVSALLFMLVQDIPALLGFLDMLSLFTGWDATAVREFASRIAPAVLFAAAYAERSGLTSIDGQPRPLSFNPRDT